MPPGASVGKHYHHGLETGYVLQGSAVLEVQGKAVKSLKVGDTYQIDPSAPHDAKNAGNVPARLLAFYVVEKGKPLAEPLP
jgi:quercetin dioxygenase-like cupin family protein